MDIIEDYVERNQGRKLKVSQMFEEHEEDIKRFNTRLDLEGVEWMFLEEHWKGLLEEFFEDNAGVEIRGDFYKIDFADLLNDARIRVADKKLQTSIVRNATATVIKRSKTLSTILSKGPWPRNPKKTITVLSKKDSKE